MRAHTHRSRAARGWYLLVGIRWQRFQSRLSGLYYQRVTYAYRIWRAVDYDPMYRPSPPWWSGFLYRWLRVTGWLAAPPPPWARSQ